MTREQLTNTLAKKIGITQPKADDIVITVLDTIKQGLVDDGRVVVRGFGCFTASNKSERMGRNPKTGEPAVITARKVVKFKASKLFKAKLN